MRSKCPQCDTEQEHETSMTRSGGFPNVKCDECGSLYTVYGGPGGTLIRIVSERVGMTHREKAKGQMHF